MTNLTNGWQFIKVFPAKGRIKGIAMGQQVNCLWNNIFVNPPPLPEISGALHLA